MAVLRVVEVVEVGHQGEVVGLERVGLGGVERGHRLDLGDRAAEQGDRHPRVVRPVGGPPADVVEGLDEVVAGPDAPAAADQERRAEAGLVPAPGGFGVAEVLEPARLDRRHAEPGVEVLIGEHVAPDRHDLIDRHRVGPLGPPPPDLHRRAMRVDPFEGLRLLLDVVPRLPPHHPEGRQVPLAEHPPRLGERDDRVAVVGDGLGLVCRHVERLGRIGQPPEARHPEHPRRQRDDDGEPEDEVEEASPPPPPPREDGDLGRRARRWPIGAHRIFPEDRPSTCFSDKCRATGGRRQRIPSGSLIP